MAEYVGDIDAHHNLDGTMHVIGQGEEHTCHMTWARVTFTDGVGAIVTGSEAIIERCPNPSCQAVDLKVVNVKLKV